MKELKIENEDFVAIVDDEDYERLTQFKWFARPNKSIYRSKRKGFKCIKTPLANEVLQNFVNLIDHKDRNPLNNIKNNLREASRVENSRNRTKQSGTTSKYKGVSWDKDRGRWRAYICRRGYAKYIGLFDREIDAAIAYNNAAKLKFGEFAVLNIIEGQP